MFSSFHCFLFVATSAICIQIVDSRIRDHHDHHRARQFLMSSNSRSGERYSICVHGVQVDRKCQCTQEYAGEFCEKKKNCANYRRFHNGSCTACLPGYTGDHCETLDCVHGKLNSLGTNCICEQPYTGKVCDEFTTADVYSFYNNRASSVGPIGALLLIPMCACYFGCNRMAKKREVKRISNLLEDQQVYTSIAALKQLMKAEDV